MPATTTSTTAESRQHPPYTTIARGVSIRAGDKNAEFFIVVPLGVASAFDLPSRIRFYCASAGAAERRLALRCRDHVLELDLWLAETYPTWKALVGIDCFRASALGSDCRQGKLSA